MVMNRFLMLLVCPLLFSCKSSAANNPYDYFEIDSKEQFDDDVIQRITDNLFDDEEPEDPEMTKLEMQVQLVKAADCWMKRKMQGWSNFICEKEQEEVMYHF